MYIITWQNQLSHLLALRWLYVNLTVKRIKAKDFSPNVLSRYTSFFHISPPFLIVLFMTWKPLICLQVSHVNPSAWQTVWLGDDGQLVRPVTTPMEAPVTASPPPNSSTFPPPVPLHPAVAPSVELGFTILYTVLYGGLFLVVYTQLWLLYLYRHKRWSYQSVFLFLCLLWAALRTTLFSFYFRNAVEANHLPVAVYWLLYCFPVCLQFFTLSLINLYFTQVRLGLFSWS